MEALGNALASAVRIKKNQTEEHGSPAGPVIWLLSPDGSGARVRKICGCLLGTDLDENGVQELDPFVCAAEAGAGTTHQGFGQCIEHESPFIPRLLDAISSKGVPQHIVDIFDSKAETDQRLMATLDPEIQGMYALLEMQLRGLPKDPTEQPSDRAIGALKTNMMAVASLKEKRRVMEDKMTLDMGIVEDFIRRIMEVVMTNSNELQARRIFHEIMNNVVKPMRSEGRISGASPLLTSTTTTTE